MLLKFLCAVFHPAVRDESGYWKEFFEAVNALLRADGYELYAESKISGRDVYGWRKYDPEENVIFVPFSERNKRAIKEKYLKLSLNLRLRKQIYSLMEKHSRVYRETYESGWQENITTIESVFRDISQFYEPKCYDENGNYVKANKMERFIMKSSPFSVLDAIEMYEKYDSNGEFSAQINALFRMHSISYRLEEGRIENIYDITVDKKDVSVISERGLKELINEAEQYYRSGNKQIAVEKIWDAFERLKTYYSPALNKSQSANKLIDNMSGLNANFKELYRTEFKALTDIGNDYRIRHHEVTKIDIKDDRQYDYFYKRCLALISVAILYLGEENCHEI